MAQQIVLLGGKVGPQVGVRVHPTPRGMDGGVDGEPVVAADRVEARGLPNPRGLAPSEPMVVAVVAWHFEKFVFFLFLNFLTSFCDEFSNFFFSCCPPNIGPQKVFFFFETFF
jgi:hypothetical protein